MFRIQGHDPKTYMVTIVLIILLQLIFLGCSSPKSNKNTISDEIMTFEINSIMVSDSCSVDSDNSIYLAVGKGFRCGINEIINYLKKDFKTVIKKVEWPKLMLKPNGDTARIQMDDMEWKFSIVQIKQNNLSLRAENITGSKDLKINMGIGESVLLEKRPFQSNKKTAYNLLFLSPSRFVAYLPSISPHRDNVKGGNEKDCFIIKVDVMIVNPPFMEGIHLCGTDIGGVVNSPSETIINNFKFWMLPKKLEDDDMIQLDFKLEIVDGEEKILLKGNLEIKKKEIVPFSKMVFTSKGNQVVFLLIFSCPFCGKPEDYSFDDFWKRPLR